MKLDVGCGRKKAKYYKGIDIREEVKPDFLGDFREMSFKNVDAVRATHLLEHFGRDEIDKIFSLWRDWLKPGGLLIIETPDFEEICNLFKDESEQMIKHAYGAQEVNGADFHKDGWYEDKFRRVLDKFGFDISYIKKYYSKRYRNPNIVVEARKRVPE